MRPLRLTLWPDFIVTAAALVFALVRLCGCGSVSTKTADVAAVEGGAGDVGGDVDGPAIELDAGNTRDVAGDVTEAAACPMVCRMTAGATCCLCKHPSGGDTCCVNVNATGECCGKACR